MITTPDLIGALAADLKPVRRLRPPLTRAACWVLLAAIVLAMLTISQGVRPDLAVRLGETAFTAHLTGAILTGVLAAVAAVMVSLPDRSRRWLLLPVPGLVLWLSTIGYQCLTGWVALRPGSVGLDPVARCVATLVLTSLPLSLAMLLMIRRAAPLQPTGATLSGSLGVAAMAAAALMLFHEIDATILILVWNLGTAALFLGLGAVLGRSGYVANVSPPTEV